MYSKFVKFCRHAGTPLTLFFRALPAHYSQDCFYNKATEALSELRCKGDDDTSINDYFPIALINLDEDENKAAKALTCKTCHTCDQNEQESGKLETEIQALFRQGNSKV